MTIPRNDAELAQMLGVDDRVAYRELEPKALRQEIRGLKEYIKTLENAIMEAAAGDCDNLEELAEELAKESKTKDKS